GCCGLTHLAAQGTNRSVSKLQNGMRGSRMEAKPASGRRLRALGAAGVLGLAWITPSALAVTACGGGAAAEEKPAETGGVSKEDEEKAQRLLDRAREENSEERLRLLITRFSGTQA